VFKHILSWNFVFSTMTIQGCTNLSLIIGNLGNWLKGALQVDATINGMLWSYWHGGNWAWFGIVRWNVICKILMCVEQNLKAGRSGRWISSSNKEILQWKWVRWLRRKCRFYIHLPILIHLVWVEIVSMFNFQKA
jgi:hypothetical protein